jgi:hypothetical protein
VALVVCQLAWVAAEVTDEPEMNAGGGKAVLHRVGAKNSEP